MSTIYTVRFEPHDTEAPDHSITISTNTGLEMAVTPQQARAMACDLVKAAYQVEVRARRPHTAPQKTTHNMAFSGT